MKFRYAGPHDAVDVPELGVTVERGHQVEATGAAAESLSRQADWQRVDKPKSAAKKTTTKAGDQQATDTTEE